MRPVTVGTAYVVNHYERWSAGASTPWAPWHIIPSDRKWYRNLAVAEALVGLLRPYRETWLSALRERGEAELAELRKAGFAPPG